MGNLGDYQKIVEIAKKVGGPRILAAIVAAGGFVAGGIVGVVGTKGAERVSKAAKKQKSAPSDTKEELYTVTSDDEESGGLRLRVGDKYRVLGRDRDSILIEVLNDANNPYFVSREFLQSVSDFEIEPDAVD